MPRGGKRPGAGARKGNFNALRSGNHSDRLIAVYFAMLEHPDKRALANLLFDAGILRKDRPFDRRRDLPAAIDFLWRAWFDRFSKDDQKRSNSAGPPLLSAPAGAPAQLQDERPGA